MAAPLCSGVHLAGADCAVLDALLLRAVVDLERRDGCAPPAVRDAVAVIHAAAIEFRDTVQVKPSSGTSDAPRRSAARRSATSEWLTTRQAATLTGTSESYLRRLARNHEVRATRARDGRGWLLDAGAVAAWAAERTRRTT
ncbi:excisionase family DNA-binding protein [Streptomyces sp. NPDC048281]|uniref:excisionase family DNA-binding protein n=1 Tax=Streptomyces sp. NPDC048281 TaxID=3154715 RepID=UPI0034258005